MHTYFKTSCCTQQKQTIVLVKKKKDQDRSHFQNKEGGWTSDHYPAQAGLDLTAILLYQSPGMQLGATMSGSNCSIHLGFHDIKIIC